MDIAVESLFWFTRIFGHQYFPEGGLVKVAVFTTRNKICGNIRYFSIRKTCACQLTIAYLALHQILIVVRSYQN